MDIAVADLAMIIVPPTLEGAVVKNGAGVPTSARYSNSCAAFAEVNWISIGSGYDSTVATQLSLTIMSPALQRTIVKHRAGELISSSNRDGSASRTKVNWYIIGLADGLMAIIFNAHWVVLTESPTLDVAIVQERAGVCTTGSDRNGRASRAEVDWCRGG